MKAVCKVMSSRNYLIMLFILYFSDRRSEKIIRFFLATDRCASLKEKSAEGAGFEPAARTNRAPDFESGAFNQLSHPSIDF